MKVNNYFIETNDWRAKVAAMTATNNQDIEKAFSDQASGFVENQVGDLMKDQYRIGFEVVKKNDNNTRMVGIFAFKVERDLIYAPVFFLNGEIKGPLLYRVNTKTFVPANKEWASYLIESMEMAEGKGRDMSRRSDSAPLVRMRDIAFLPPGMGKHASTNYERAYEQVANRADGPHRPDKKIFRAIEDEMSRDGSASKMKADEYAKEFRRRYDEKYSEKKASKDTTGVENGKNSSCDCSCYCLCCEGKGKTINVPSKQKHYDAPTDDMTGEYEVRGMNENRKQPELNTGESFFKVAQWDDGTVRIETVKGWVPMTREEGYEIKRASEQGYARIVIDGEVEHILSKEAAAQVAALIDEPSTRSADTINECLEKIAEFMDAKGTIAEFLKEADYGKPACDAIIKAAGNSYGFANMLAGIYGTPSNFIPDKFNFTPVEKAAAVNKGELAMYYDLEELTKAAGYEERELVEFFKSGAVLHDTRTDALSVVEDSAPDMLTAPDSPGEYSLLKSDGTFLEGAFVAQAYDGPFGTDSKYGEYGTVYGSIAPSCAYVHSGRTSLPRYVVISDGKVHISNELLGIKTKTADKSDKAKDMPVSRKVYYIYIPSSETVVGPVAIKEIKDVGGVKHCRAIYDTHYDADRAIWPNGEKPLVINHDLDTSDLNRAVFGSDAKWIEVTPAADKREGITRDIWDGHTTIKVEKLEDIGSTESLDNWIYSKWNVPKVKVEAFVEDGKTASFRFTSGNRKSDRVHRNTALIKLAHTLRIPGKKAYELVERAEKNGSVEFYVDGLTKTASHLYLAERPNLDDEFDSEFGIPMVPEKKFILRVQGDQIQEQPSSIGDAMNPTSPTGLPNLTVATSDPGELQMLADTYHLPNVFEHGVIGTLADTFNAVYLIDKYLAKVEDAVDVLGRIKFLIYWCPGDFERAYGSDDMANFEAEIDANFESLGALLLKLLKKSDKQKKNTGKQEEEKTR